jgi:hypothetical protein
VECSPSAPCCLRQAPNPLLHASCGSLNPGPPNCRALVFPAFPCCAAGYHAQTHSRLAFNNTQGSHSLCHLECGHTAPFLGLGQRFSERRPLAGGHCGSAIDSGSVRLHAQLFQPDASTFSEHQLTGMHDTSQFLESNSQVASAVTAVAFHVVLDGGVRCFPWFARPFLSSCPAKHRHLNTTPLCFLSVPQVTSRLAFAPFNVVRYMWRFLEGHQLCPFRPFT